MAKSERGRSSKRVTKKGTASSRRRQTGTRPAAKKSASHTARAGKKKTTTKTTSRASKKKTAAKVSKTKAKRSTSSAATTKRRRVRPEQADRQATAKRSAQATGKKVASKKAVGKKTAAKKTKVVTKKKLTPATRKKTTGSSSRKKTLRQSGTTGSPQTKTARPKAAGVKKPTTAKKAATTIRRSPSAPKRSRAGAASADQPPVRQNIIIGGLELVDPTKPLPKTKLTKKQLREFQGLLLAKRRELLGDVDQLSNEALRRSREHPGGEPPSMPSHMADAGSDNWEQEFTIGLIETEKALLQHIYEALRRIENRTYGVCLATHRMISADRLRAKPWAQYCIEYARLRDTGRIPRHLF